MAKISVYAQKFGAGPTDNPTLTAFVAENSENSVQVNIETMQIPVACAALIAASQESVMAMNPADVASDMEWNFENSTQFRPDAVDIMVDGDVLCVNVGTGGIFFKPTDRAKQSLKKFPASW